MDPHAVLGVPADASLEEATTAFRALAKQHHPDVDPGPRAAEVMARINAAYAEVRLRASAPAATDPVPPDGPRGPSAHARPRRGAWLPEHTRRALGGELLAALEQQEQVVLVVPTATWASPESRLALTDHRLLWLADDQPTHRVRSLRFRDVERVQSKLASPRRRGTAHVRLRTRAGRRLDFGDLDPQVALRIARAVGGADAA